MYEHLGGNAAVVETGAAKLSLLNNSDSVAKVSCGAGNFAPTPRANNDNVIVKHTLILPQLSALLQDISLLRYAWL